MKTTVRSFLLGALFAALPACATQGVSPTDQAWMLAALEAPADGALAEDATPAAPLEARVDDSE